MHTHTHLCITSVRRTMPEIIALLFCPSLQRLYSLYVHGIFGWKGFGFAGSPMATATSTWLLCVFLHLYALRSYPNIFCHYKVNMFENQAGKKRTEAKREWGREAWNHWPWWRRSDTRFHLLTHSLVSRFPFLCISPAPFPRDGIISSFSGVCVCVCVCVCL